MLSFHTVHFGIEILPFFMQFQPALKGFKNILLYKWHLIQNQANPRELFKESPLISYRKGKWLVKAKLRRALEHHRHTAGVTLVCQTHFTCILHKMDIFGSFL